MNRKTLVILIAAAVLFPLASASASDTTAPVTAPATTSPVTATSPAPSASPAPAKTGKSRRRRPEIKNKAGQRVTNPEVKN